MAISPHLIRQLAQALGTDAAEDLVSQLERGELSRADLAELRHEMQLGFAGVDARFASLDARIDARFAAVDARFAAVDARFASVDGRFGSIDEKLAALDQKIDLKVDGLRLEIREQVAGATSRLLKWSFVFWVSAVGAIAGLAGVLR